MNLYCLGFAFATSCYAQTYVALIRKTKPEWQAGHLNGIGGKLEPGDFGSAPLAMAREFYEETKFPNSFEWWTPFCDMHVGEDAIVSCFALQLNWEDFEKLTSPTEEQVEKIRVDQVYWFSPIPNLAWLVPMAQAFLANRALPYLTIKTQ